MKVCWGSRNFDGDHQGVMTIGVFDGVHRGHQALIKKVVSQAKSIQRPSILYTVDPHPLELVNARQKVKRLFPISYMEEVTRSLGLDYLVIEKFSKEFSQISSSDFFKDYIHNIFKPQFLFVGPDFRFGWNREGSIEDLKKWTDHYHFQLEICSPLLLEGKVVSSSLMRKVFSESNFFLLSKILGRPFSVKGRVVSGKAFGKKLGFPTANVQVMTRPYPDYGVYVCKMKIKDREYPGVMNWGINPTFGGDDPKMEVHLLNYHSKSLENMDVTVYPLHRIRSEQKFDDISLLTQAIQQDVSIAQQYFLKNRL